MGGEIYIPPRQGQYPEGQPRPSGYQYTFSQGEKPQNRPSFLDLPPQTQAAIVDLDMRGLRDGFTMRVGNGDKSARITVKTSEIILPGGARNSRVWMSSQVPEVDLLDEAGTYICAVVDPIRSK